jgi:HlyD family secretion protein
MANSKPKRRRKIYVFSAILVVLASLSVVAFYRKREVVISIQTEKVSRRNLTELVVANGKIQPVLQVVINPEVSGEIVELPVREGQEVKKGDLLVKIKPDNYVASRNSALATYQSSIAGKNLADANLNKADLEYQRYQKLFESKLVSDSQFLEAKTSLDVMKATVETAVYLVDQSKAALARAEDDLSKTTIYSPITGTISRVRSQVGERVVGTAMMAGTEILTVANLDEMEARVDIGEIDVILIAVGQTARLEVDAFKDRKFHGIVTEIANSAKGTPGGSLASSSTPSSSGGQSQEATKFEVKIRVHEKEFFRPGMSVTAEIETRARTNVLTVPIQSVTMRVPKKIGDDKKESAGKERTNSTAEVATKSTAAAGTNSASLAGTNSSKSAGPKKPGEAPKPIEVVFLVEGDRVKMTPVKRGISDDAYVEITEGLKEEQEVVSGGYKAINRELEDAKKIKKGGKPEEPSKDEKEK